MSGWISSAVSKSAAAAIKPAIDAIREQVGRRGASQIAGQISLPVAREFEEALALIFEQPGTLPGFLAHHAKRALSDIPDVFEDEDVRIWLQGEDVRPLVIEGARAAIAGRVNDAARRTATASFVKNLGDFAWWGEFVFDCAVAFLSLTIKTKMDAGQRAIIDNANFNTELLSQQISGLFEHHLGTVEGAHTTKSPDAIVDGAPAHRLRFCEERGFADQSDEELGLFCAEFIAAYRRDPRATIAIEVVDDCCLAEELAALRGAASLDPGQRRHKLALEAIDLRYRNSERALAEQLSFMLTSEEVGTIWFGGQDFTVQGKAVRTLGLSFQAWKTRPVRTCPLIAFPNARQMEPAIKFMLDEDERGHFYKTNDITHPEAQLSANGGLSLFNLEYELRVTRFVPALVQRIHGIAQQRGISMTAVLAECEEHVFAWALAGD